MSPKDSEGLVPEERPSIETLPDGRPSGKTWPERLYVCWDARADRFSAAEEDTWLAESPVAAYTPLDRLKGVERQREEEKQRTALWRKDCEAAEEDRDEAEERAGKAEAGLAERDQQVREAVETRLARQRELDQTSFIRGTRAALLAVLEDLRRLTQPSSNPPQQDREVGEFSDDDLGEIGRLFIERALTDRRETLKQIGVPVADVDDQTGLWLNGLREARDRGLIPQLAEAVGFKKPQPEADPEVQGCGGSGTDPEKRGATSAAGCPGCIDCQSTPELLGEEGCEDEIRDQAVANVDARNGYTCEFSPDPDGVREEYDDEEERLREELTASTQPVSESPGDSGEDGADDEKIRRWEKEEADIERAQALRDLGDQR